MAAAVTGPSRSTRGVAPVRSTMVDAAPCADGPPSRYTPTRSPSCSRASAAVTAAGLPDMLALDTAIGPTSRSSSIATGCSGIRSMTVPWASPRSHCSDGACRTTRLSAPGQNARISSRAAGGTE